MYPRVLDSFLLFFRLLLSDSCNVHYFISNLTVCSISVCNMQVWSSTLWWHCCGLLLHFGLWEEDCSRVQKHKKYQLSTARTQNALWEHKTNALMFDQIQSTKRTLCSCLCSNHCTLYILALSGGQTVFFMMSPFLFGVTMFFLWYHIFFLSATIFLSNGTMFSVAKC